MPSQAMKPCLFHLLQLEREMFEIWHLYCNLRKLSRGKCVGVQNSLSNQTLFLVQGSHHLNDLFCLGFFFPALFACLTVSHHKNVTYFGHMGK